MGWVRRLNVTSTSGKCAKTFLFHCGGLIKHQEQGNDAGGSNNRGKQ